MEIELKFQLTDASRKNLESVLRNAGGRSKLLAARYFDTPEGDLALAGLSLRLRKEGRVWFQTLKSADGAASAVRGEQNVRLGGIAGPQPDLSHHKHTEDGARLERLLAHSSGAGLICKYSTEIRRLSARIGSRARIDYALDSGRIIAQADGDDRPLALPVCEMEMELVSGPVSGLLSAVRKLLQEHEAWLDVRSKSQRGDALARGALIAAPAKARPLLVASGSLKALVEAALADCARQVLQNASQLAAPEGGESEHVHQLRIGLRRLRSAIRLFDNVTGGRMAGWESQAKLLASGLGGNRDIDMMAESLWSLLREAGAPLVELPLHDTLLSPADLIRDASMQQWLLGLVALELEGVGDVSDGDWTLILPVLRDWHHRCRKGALLFSSFDADRRHRLRKRLKRLKYALEFIEYELPPKRYRRFAKAVASALDDLGRYNDLQVALRSYREFAEIDPRTWFAIGWLQTRLAKAESRCAKSLAAFHEADPPWNLTD